MTAIAPDFDPAQFSDLAAVLPLDSIQSLAQSFCETVHGLLDSLSRDAGDARLLREQAHDLKSVAGNFGAAQLSALAERLEHSSDAVRELPALLAAMHSTATVAFAALDAELAKLG